MIELPLSKNKSLPSIKTSSLEDFISKSKSGEVFTHVKVITFEGNLSALQRQSDKVIYILKWEDNEKKPLEILKKEGLF